MESEVLAKTVEERGIDFEPTDDDLGALRKAGAQDVLITAIRVAKPRPITREQVLKLIVAGVPSPRAAALVKQRGIDFIPDEDYVGTLRVAGADETLIAALRAAGEAVTVEVTIVTSPNAEVYLDGTLHGRANAQGELVVKSKPGMHAVKISLTGKKDNQREVTFVAGTANKVEALLEDVGPAAGDVKVNPKDGLKYVWIPPGTFMIGCSPGDSECVSDEKPAHQVTITKGFWLGQTEVTVGAYKRYSRETGKAMPEEPRLGKNTLNPGWGNEQMPIVNVSWDDATAYCAFCVGGPGTTLPGSYEFRTASVSHRRSGTTASVSAVGGK